MKCFRQDCSKAAPMDTLFRVNAKGRPGIWACAAHRLEKDVELDAIVKALETQQNICQPKDHQ